MAGASRPSGATISTRSARSASAIGARHYVSRGAVEFRHPGQHTTKFPQRRPDANAALRLEHELANRALMRATALFYHRYRLLYLSSYLEEAHVHNRVGEITEVHGRFRGGGQPLLRQNEDRQHALLVQIGRKLVQLVGEEFLAGHRVEITIERVDDHQPAAFPDALQDAVCELPARDLRGVHLLQGNETIPHVTAEIQPE